MYHIEVTQILDFLSNRFDNKFVPIQPLTVSNLP